MLQKIISGGQTGADRAALDAARYYPNMKWGGWCPRGRPDEDGRIPEEYFNQGQNGLVETSSGRYPVRTKLNVQDSDGTLAIRCGKITRGTGLAVIACRELQKPYWLCDPYYAYTQVKTAQWICENNIGTLNVAGPRASKFATIYDATLSYLRDVIYLVWLYDRKDIAVWNLKKQRKEKEK